MLVGAELGCVVAVVEAEDAIACTELAVLGDDAELTVDDEVDYVDSAIDLSSM